MKREISENDVDVFLNQKFYTRNLIEVRDFVEIFGDGIERARNFN